MNEFVTIFLYYHDDMGEFIALAGITRVPVSILFSSAARPLCSESFGIQILAGHYGLLGRHPFLNFHCPLGLNMVRVVMSILRMVTKLSIDMRCWLRNSYFLHCV